MINDIYELNIEIKEFETEKVGKSINTIYNKIFEISELEVQIKEMKDFILI